MSLVVNDGEFSYNNFFVSYADDADNIWFGSRGYGAYSISPRQPSLTQLTFDKYNNKQTLNDVFSILKDNNGNRWYGTSAGLIRQDPQNQTTIYDEKDGLPNNTVHGILQDSKKTYGLAPMGALLGSITNGIFFRCTTATADWM